MEISTPLRRENASSALWARLNPTVVSQKVAALTALSLHSATFLSTGRLDIRIFGDELAKGENIPRGWRSLFHRAHSYVDGRHVVRGCANYKCSRDNLDNLLAHRRTDRHDHQAHDFSGASRQAR